MTWEEEGKPEGEGGASARLACSGRRGGHLGDSSPVLPPPPTPHLRSCSRCHQASRPRSPLPLGSVPKGPSPSRVLLRARNRGRGRYANACPLGGDSGPDKAGHCAKPAASPTTFGAFGGATVSARDPTQGSRPGAVSLVPVRPRPLPAGALLTGAPLGALLGGGAFPFSTDRFLPQRILGEIFKHT